MRTSKSMPAVTMADMNYAYVQAMNNYIAERVIELVIDAHPGASQLMKHCAILHRQDAAETAKKAGATPDDLRDATEDALRAFEKAVRWPA